jgi:hypothetical protein
MSMKVSAKTGASSEEEKDQLKKSLEKNTQLQSFILKIQTLLLAPSVTTSTMKRAVCFVCPHFFECSSPT